MTDFVASNVPIKRFLGGKTKTATPKNTNRPGFSSKPSAPTGTNRPGFSAPRPSFLSGLGSDNSELPAKRRATRDRFFDGDTSISKDRLDRRYTQFVENEKFKKDLKDTNRVLRDSRGNVVMNANTGEPVFLGATPVFDTNTASPTFGQFVSKTVADRANELALKYGPKPSEIMSDIGKGLGSITQGLAEKGPPIMQLFSGIRDKFAGMMPQEGTPSFTNPNDIIGLVNALPDMQKRIYYDLLGSGVPYQKAYEQASGLPFTKFQQMAHGGIATLQ